ncbi:MAG TPA: class I SAM-dependent methyltransferase [Candidatus Polarisedimenticolaceae bacterium]|nr:class I SAM-dependent methyltransferase [Candidatus Polarisedimenticolaceae bacterium]
MDRSNGYEGVAAEFIAGRGGPQSSRIGATFIRRWARGLPPGATVLDVACGTGIPTTETLLDEGLSVYAVDAAPSFVAAFQSRFPEVPVVCEPAEESSFFGRTFDAVLSWGLMFLLEPSVQEAVIRRMADALTPAGRLLFTSPPQVQTWSDAMTGLESRSLGAEAYRRFLSVNGLTVLDEYEDEGENHYYDAIKKEGTASET